MNDRKALQARVEALLTEQHVRRIVVGRGNSGDRGRGQPDCGVPGRARPGRPGEPVLRQASGVGPGARRLHQPHRAGHRVRGGRQAGRRPRAGGDGQGRRAELAALRPRGDRSRGQALRRRLVRRARLPARARDRVSVLAPKAMESDAVKKGRLLAAGILAGFFVLAFTFALLVSRSLQRQIDSFLQAARRLGGGDFTVEVPTAGHDEFAALGEEFNKMSRQLEERLEELNQERARLQDAMRRIGETFAANLDREGAAGDRGQDRGRRRRRPTPGGRPCAPTRTRRSSRWR